MRIPCWLSSKMENELKMQLIFKQRGHSYAHLRRNSNEIQKFTFLNVSRVHKISPKPRIIFGCWVFDVKIKYIRCIFSVNKYQVHWPSLSSNISNSLDICSLFSQKMKIITNAHNISVNGVRILIGSEIWCSYIQYIQSN